MRFLSLLLLLLLLLAKLSHLLDTAIADTVNAKLRKVKHVMSQALTLATHVEYIKVQSMLFKFTQMQ